MPLTSFTAIKQAVRGINLDIGRNEVIALIGPSGCGKSTFIRCLNRMNDTIADCRVEGSIQVDGQDIYQDDLDVVALRAQVGMVFQKPNPFPKSISRTWRTDHGFMALREPKRNSKTLSNPPCVARACGKR